MHRFIALTLLMLASMPAAAESTCDVSYRIAPRYDTQPRRLEVAMTFAAERRLESWLRLQVGWAGIQDYGQTWRPSPEQPSGVTVTPEDTHRWQVTHAPEGLVTVRYQILAALPDPDDGKVQDQEQMYRTQIGADWFQFFGYGALPSVESFDDRRVGRMCVTLVQPEGEVGPLIGSDLNGRVQADAQISLQDSHAGLRHAFYGGGPGWRVERREGPGGAVIVASRGTQSAPDVAFADSVVQLISAHRRFWGDTEAPKQTIVRIPNNGWNNGGTLVRQTAVLHVSRDFGPHNAAFESLIGHENLHQWMPGRLGGRQNDSPEQAAHHSWLSEGFTDYYTHRLLLGAGVWTLDQYAEQLTQVFRKYWRSPERHATADSIAPRFFSDRAAGSQMYVRGEWLAMTWDRALREQDPSGLDGVLRGLLLTRQQAMKAGAAHERVLAALTTRLGDAPRQQVKATVEEGRGLALEEGLAGPCFTVGWADVPRWAPGFDVLKIKGGPPVVATGVIPQGPAAQAGLKEGMMLKGWSIFGGEVTKEIELNVTVDGETKTLRYLPVDGTFERLPLLSVRAGAGSDAACQQWIRRPRS